MRALVTGVADVVGIDCFTDYYPRSVKERNLSALRGTPAFRFVESTIQSADLAHLLGDRTHVFHCAAQAGVRKSWGRDFAVYAVNNIEATQVLLEACTRVTLDRVVYASSSSVYGDNVPMPVREDALPQPVSPYGVTKLAAEQLCHLYHVNYGLPTVSLRYFTVYGPPQRPDMGFHRFLRAAILGEPIAVFGDGEQTRDFTFVTDAVAATVARRRAALAAACTISEADRGYRSTRCSTSSAACRVGRFVWSATRRRKATCATPLPIRHAQRPISASRRGSRSRTASPPNIDGSRSCWHDPHF
jgi:nucleoside-diphosphate-sugar epimerase